MKVIDLLNKIANGEEVPKKIKYDNDIWYYDEIAKDYFLTDKSGEEYLICEELNLMFALNDEVEIIEEKKIENIGKHFSLHYIKTNIDEETQDELDNTINEIYDKIDEIIDAVNKLTK